MDIMDDKKNNLSYRNCRLLLLVHYGKFCKKQDDDDIIIKL